MASEGVRVDPERGLMEQAPPQYGTGRCVCGTRLSTYNPYFICGPCRTKTTAAVAVTVAEGDGDEMPPIVYAWEAEPKRRPLRRGPLFIETLLR